ncbi:MAG: hypothetical protein WBK77_07290, partial [Alphaproteobacteria bacterium]
VALFGALAFVISRGMRSETTTGMSERQAELAAVDIISYGQRLERAVGMLQRNGTSENDISFDNPIVSGYIHTPAQPDTHNIFHSAGGKVNWQSPASNVNDGSPWHFTGRSCITGLGTGGAGCGLDSVSNEELIAVLPNIKASVCQTIDKKLGIAAIPANSGGAYSATKFTGAFTDGSEITLPTAYNAACYSQGGAYHFYYALLSR